MDFWSKARSFAEEAAKRSQELTMEAAKRSQELTSTIRIPEIVSETAKRSKEIAAEASNQIKAEALKRADLIKSISLLDPASSSEKKQQVSEEELERYGVTEELREFVKGITMSTFQDFPLQGNGDCCFFFLGLLFRSGMVDSSWVCVIWVGFLDMGSFG